MNLDRAAAIKLAEAVVNRAGDFPNVDIALLSTAGLSGSSGESSFKHSRRAGHQNMYHEPKGAFTGEVSPNMLLDCGCRYVILGHSEHRDIFRETDADVNRKLKAALSAGLLPIVCVGEHLAEREAGQTAEVIRSQFDGSFTGISAEDMQRTTISYEPVWAIGTGKVATPQQAEEVHADLRKMIQSRYNTDVASQVRIQYGGSVKPSNSAELMHEPDIDGALVGGASLVADDFLGIIASCT